MSQKLKKPAPETTPFMVAFLKGLVFSEMLTYVSAAVRIEALPV